jgi:hypothetical protein
MPNGIHMSAKRRLETSSAQIADVHPAAQVEEACLFVGKKFAGLVLNP